MDKVGNKVTDGNADAVSGPVLGDTALTGPVGAGDEEGATGATMTGEEEKVGCDVSPLVGGCERLGRKISSSGLLSRS